MRHKITYLSIFIVLSSVVLGYLVYKNNQKRINSVVLVQHTIEVGYQTAIIGAIEAQIKTLITNYKNTKDTSLLAPINLAKANMFNEIDQLIYLTRDNRLQNQRAHLLKQYSKAILELPSLEVISILTLIQQEEQRLLKIRKNLYAQNLNAFNWFNLIVFSCLLLLALLLLFAIRKINFQLKEKNQRAGELDVANQTLFHETTQKKKRAYELTLAKKELYFQHGEKGKRAAELLIADKELHYQSDEKEKRAAELKKTIIQLNKSESSLKEAQAISHIGNFEIDLVHDTEVWSEGIYTILGIAKSDSKPTINYFLKFIHPADIGFIREAIKNSFLSYSPNKLEFRFYTSDGSLRYAHAEAQFELINEVPIRLFGIFQDITENKLAELDRNKMVKELIQRNKDLEQFAYIISHNLRAPVANILGASEILKDEAICKSDETILKNGINESVLKLDDVIKDLNHILDVKISNHHQQEVVSFKGLVADIKNSITKLIEQNDIRIAYDFKEVENLLTLKPYLYSIFYNLITNSIKYRKPNKPVKINISSRKTSTGVELSFADNGLGINLKKNGAQLFGLYRRFHAHVEGKGMGLFMVKTQVEALDGSIQVFSSGNKGTTFKINF